MDVTNGRASVGSGNQQDGLGAAAGGSAKMSWRSRGAARLEGNGGLPADVELLLCGSHLL